MILSTILGWLPADIDPTATTTTIAGAGNVLTPGGGVAVGDAGQAVADTFGRAKTFLQVGGAGALVIVVILGVIFLAKPANRKRGNAIAAFAIGFVFFASVLFAPEFWVSVGTGLGLDLAGK